MPCLLLWGLAVPGLAFLFLYRQRRSTEEGYQVRFGFLTSGYQSERFFWEYVIIYRKLLIIAFIVFFAQVSLFLQALSTLGILLVSVALQSFQQPYFQPALNSLEQRALTVATLTLYSGLLFYNESLGQVGEALLFAFISGLNVVFTFLCLVKIGFLGLRLVWKRYRNSPMSVGATETNPPML